MSILSVLIGLIGITYGLYFEFTYPKTGFTGYFHMGAFVLMVTLPPSIILLSHQIDDFLLGIKILFGSMISKSRKTQTEIITTLTRCSAKVRTEGVGALNSERKSIQYDLLRDGISLILNNFTMDEIQHNLAAKIKARQSKMQMASGIFIALGKLSPGVGLMGTVMGLIGMMSNMGDPQKIGSGMASALICTLYGLLMANVLYTPFGEKIAIESEKIHELDMLVMDGVMALKAKKSSAHFKDIVKTYSKNPNSQSNNQENHGVA